MEMITEEKHELTISFASSEELWQFAEEHRDKVVCVVDYKLNTVKGERYGVHED